MFFSLFYFCEEHTSHIIQFYYLFKLIDNKRGEGIAAQLKLNGNKHFTAEFQLSMQKMSKIVYGCRNGSDGNIYSLIVSWFWKTLQPLILLSNIG